MERADGDDGVEPPSSSSRSSSRIRRKRSPGAQAGRSRASRTPRPRARSSARPGHSRRRARGPAGTEGSFGRTRGTGGLGHDGGDYGQRDGRPPPCGRGTGLREPVPARDRHERRGRDPPALLRPARFDLDGRAQPPDRARRAASETTRGRAVSNLLSQGRIFEYWAHEACLLPIESWPLFRRAMQNGGRDWYSNVNDVTSSHPELANEVLGEIRERGPLASRHFEGAAGGGMWNWKPAKAMLERLWNHGALVIAGRAGLPAGLRPHRAGDPAGAARGGCADRSTTCCGRSPSRRSRRAAR